MTEVRDRYAQAIYELASDPAELDQVARTLSEFARLYGESRELREALENPVFPMERREAVLVDVASALGGSEDSLATRALRVLFSRRRLPILAELAQTLRKVADERKGIVRAQVTTATALNEGFYEQVGRALSEALGKNVVVERAVDPQLIGGAITEVMGRTIDRSVRGQLRRVEQDLLMLTAQQSLSH